MIQESYDITLVKRKENNFGITFDSVIMLTMEEEVWQKKINVL